MKQFPPYALSANRTYDLMQEQQRYGVRFDIDAAKQLHAQIDQRMTALEAEINPQLPGRPLNRGEMSTWTPPKIQFKKDGTPSAACLNFFNIVYNGPEGWEGMLNNICVDLPHHEPLISSLPMEVRHQDAMKNWLLELGWKPTIWNYKLEATGLGKRRPVRDDKGQLTKASPKLHDKGRVCPGLSVLAEQVPVIEWMSLRNRRSTIWNEEKNTGWLSHPRLAHDGRLPAASSGLTNTKRQRHTIVANVPRVGTLMGAEMRSLFRASEGMVMVGVDVKALEACIKGHYTYPYDDGAYAKLLLQPDFDEHKINAGLWGCSREQAKSPGYALQYNCQPPKFAETLGVPLGVGKKHYEAYWAHNWSLKLAITEAETEFDRNFQKYITTIDGSKVVTRAKHSVFNARCQSAGAKVVDMVGIIADKYIKTRGFPARRVIYYHDEYQYDCEPGWDVELSRILVDSIRLAGEHFHLNVPLTGTAKIGSSWAETH